MRKTAILGIGQTSVGEHWELSLRELAGQAILEALNDARRDTADGIFVGNMLSGMLAGQENLGSLIADWTGIRGKEAYKVEAACGSGAAALRVGLMAVASGEMDCALVVGVEKMTETKGVDTTAALASAADADYEAAQGVSFVALNALVMQRYLHEFGWKHTDFAQFSINAHANALANPYARLHEAITEADYKKSRMVAEPINLLDASPIGDGAAALVIVPDDPQHIRDQQLVTIAGSASATDTLALHDRPELLWLSAAEKSARRAYEQAGIQPEDVDVFELHDAFSIMSALSLEACGFIGRGRGPQLAIEGEILPGGKIPICTRGGLKARGHPVGATGVYQIVEVVQQLRGEAGNTQVPGARIGMAQNIGGSGATVITHVLTKGVSR
jgi:acetyl-CoA C-acetyltransferase